MRLNSQSTIENTDPRVEPWERLIFPLPVSSPSGNKLLRVAAGLEETGQRGGMRGDTRCGSLSCLEAREFHGRRRCRGHPPACRSPLLLDTAGSHLSLEVRPSHVTCVRSMKCEQRHWLSLPRQASGSQCLTAGSFLAVLIQEAVCFRSGVTGRQDTASAWIPESSHGAPQPRSPLDSRQSCIKVMKNGLMRWMQARDLGHSNRVNLKSLASNAGSPGWYGVWMGGLDLLQPFCFHEGSQPEKKLSQGG